MFAQQTDGAFLDIPVPRLLFIGILVEFAVPTALAVRGDHVNTS